MAWTIPEDNHLGRGFMGTILALIVIDLFCVLIRLYTRFLQRAVPDLSDYMLLVGFIMTNGFVVIMWAGYSHGLGLERSRFTLADAEMSWKTMAPGSIVWYGSTTAIRVSMTLFYRQLFHPVKTFIRISGSIIALNGLAFLVVIITNLVICRPMRYAVFHEGNGHCGDIRAFQSYTSTSAIVLDAITVALPMPLLWNLSMTRRRKWGLSVIFGLGILICATTVLRLIITYEFHPDKATIQSAVAMFLAGLEPTLGIIIACMPCFPAFIARLRTRHRWFLSFGSVEHSHTNSGSGSGGSRPGAGAYVNCSTAAAAAAAAGGTTAKAIPDGNLKVLIHSHRRRLLCQDDSGGESDVFPAYPLDTVAVGGRSREYCYSAIELGVLEDEQQGTTARQAGAARGAEQGRIYITRAFDIQSHSPQSSSVVV